MTNISSYIKILDLKKIKIMFNKIVNISTENDTSKAVSDYTYNRKESAIFILQQFINYIADETALSTLNLKIYKY